MTKAQRKTNLLPNGVPRYVRCYDDGECGDRYTVVYTGNYRNYTGGEFIYVGMSAAPFHPQGIGQHGQHNRQIDVNKYGFPPAMGRKNHLGKRIPFSELPEDCQRLVLDEYMELWGIEK